MRGDCTCSSYFNLLNHNEIGQRSLEDVIGIFGRQLRALGHTAIWDQKNDKFVQNGGFNVVVEGFTHQTIGLLANAHAQGCRFLILATEEPTLKDPNGSYSDPANWKGFNHGTQVEMIQRMFAFPHAAKFCEGILHLVPGEHVKNWYGQFARASYVELGYAPSLERWQGQPEPDYDFGFYGSGTPRRERLLKRLARRCN